MEICSNLLKILHQMPLNHNPQEDRLANQLAATRLQLLPFSCVPPKRLPSSIKSLLHQLIRPRLKPHLLVLHNNKKTTPNLQVSSASQKRIQSLQIKVSSASQNQQTLQNQRKKARQLHSLDSQSPLQASLSSLLKALKWLNPPKSSIQSKLRKMKPSGLNL